MRALILAALAAMTAGSRADAQDEARALGRAAWVVIAADSEKVTRLDTARVQPLPDSAVRVWFQRDYRSAQPLDDTSKTYRSLQEQIVVDCRGRRMRWEALTFLDERETPVDGGPTQGADAQWRPVRPGSRGDLLVQKACALLASHRPDHSGS